MCALVRDGGARVLLSGHGADHYLAGSRTYLADLVARGRWAAAARDAARYAVRDRGSFWRCLWRHGLYPLAPAPLRLRWARESETLPDWVDPGFARRVGMAGRLELVLGQGAGEGSRFAAETAYAVDVVTRILEREPFDEGLELRYPFLYRPLVEFSLRLPPRLRIRPEGDKWVLREAMRGVLPEVVRTRRGKGGIDGRILWSLHRERGRLTTLLRAPRIAREGWVDAAKLREAVERARCGEVRNLVFLLSSLSLESWLAVREGRWPERTEEGADAA
jgi:asparagine synthase (glutamine-hydrolysing)